MKKLFYTTLVVLSFTACANPKKEEKASQDDVFKLHEKTMADDEKAMINKMKLDTVIHKLDSLKTNKQEVAKLSTNLIAADDAMSNWMKNFNPDYTGKSHDDVMKYLREQKLQVKQIDSLLLDATKQSEQYLLKVKK